MGCGASRGPDPSVREVRDELKQLREAQQSLVEQQGQLLDTVNALRTALSEREAKYVPSSPNIAPNVPDPEGSAGKRRSKVGIEQQNGEGTHFSNIPLAEEEQHRVSFKGDDAGGPRVRRKSTGFGSEWKRQVGATDVTSGLVSNYSPEQSGITGPSVKSSSSEGKGDQHAGFVPMSGLPDGNRVQRKKTSAGQDYVMPMDAEEGEEGDGEQHAGFVHQSGLPESHRVQRKKTSCAKDWKEKEEEEEEEKRDLPTGFVPQSELPESHRVKRKKTSFETKDYVDEAEEEDAEKKVTLEAPAVSGGRVNRQKTGSEATFQAELAAARAAAEEEEDE